MYEEEFQKRVNANPQWKTQYGNLLNDLGSVYDELRPYGFARDYFNEIVNKVELFTIIAQLNSLVTAYDRDGEKGYQEKLPQVTNTLDGLFEEYNATVDKKLFETLMEMYMKDQEDKNISMKLKEMVRHEGVNSMANLAIIIYGADNFSNKSFVMDLLKKPAAELIQTLKLADPAALYRDILKTYQTEVQGKLNGIQSRINKLQRTYMQAQMEVMKERKFYPDANSTLRVTYGNVKGYSARDAVKYDYYTYLDGVMEKYKPGDYEFDVPEKMRTLYNNKDYGPYGSNGKMPVCFIAANHTTGGNSGSPALDAWGNLVGLNFDRVWEGTMSDINYDPSICRNIMVDIRYVLFIVDKFAGAGHLVQEMKLVHPKRK